jgi:hypothetical protein
MGGMSGELIRNHSHIMFDGCRNSVDAMRFQDWHIKYFQFFAVIGFSFLVPNSVFEANMRAELCSELGIADLNFGPERSGIQNIAVF